MTGAFKLYDLRRTDFIERIEVNNVDIFSFAPTVSTIDSRKVNM